MKKTQSIAIIGILAVTIGILFALGLASRNTESKESTASDLTKVLPSSPNATLARGEAASVLKGLALDKLVEEKTGRRPDYSTQNNGTADTIGDVRLILYNSTLEGQDVIVASFMNKGSKPVIVHSFLLEGYAHCDIGQDCATRTLYRPVISSEYNVVKPTTTVAEDVKRGQSLTAYMIDSLDQDGYGASACYAYDVDDPSTYHCIYTSPIHWFR